MRAAERAMAARVAAASTALAERIAAAVPDASVAALPGGGVEVVGRRLARRMLASAALRWPAGLSR